MSPFPNIALTIEAIGFGQLQYAQAEHFSINWQRQLFTAFVGLDDHPRGLLPSRTCERENNRIEISLGH